MDEIPKHKIMNLSKFHGRIKELSREEIDHLLSASKVGRMGLSLNDKPYVVPVTHWYDSGKIYFHSPDGKKIRYIKQNPSVCYEIDELAEDGSWRSVIIYGKITLATDMETVMKVFQKALGSKWSPSMMGTMHPETNVDDDNKHRRGTYVGWIDIIKVTGRKGDQ